MNVFLKVCLAQPVPSMSNPMSARLVMVSELTVGGYVKNTG